MCQIEGQVKEESGAAIRSFKGESPDDDWSDPGGSRWRDPSKEGEVGEIAGSSKFVSVVPSPILAMASEEIRGISPPTPQSLPTLPSTSSLDYSRRRSVHSTLFPISPSVPNSVRAFRATAQTLPPMQNPRDQTMHPQNQRPRRAHKDGADTKTPPKRSHLKSFIMLVC